VALSPGIPTSFVPKQPLQTPKRKQSTGNNIFMLVSLAVAGLSIIAAGGIFAYSQLLAHEQTAKAAELQKEQDAVSDATVKDYIRLKDRLDSGETLLNNHILLSQFFTELESVTLQDVQFTSLTIDVAGDGSAKITLNGLAKNFNALAVQSNAIAADANFKEAIFSGIGFDQGGKIKFTLTADIDPSLIHMTEKQAAAAPVVAPLPDESVQAPPPVATSSATTTP
jgi:Tfp pilus assembly protein PilN